MTTATHAYVVFRGGYPALLEEQWQFGVRFMLVNSGTAPDSTGTLPTFDVDAVSVGRTETDWTISSEWNAGLGSLESIVVDDWLNDQLLPSFVTLLDNCRASSHVEGRSIKVSPITSSGHVADLRTATGEYTGTKPPGGSSGNMVPPEVSIVGSWLTERIGRRGRGRIYLPPTTVGFIDTLGQIVGTAQGDIADALVAFLEGCAITPTGLGNHWALPIVTGHPWTQYAVVEGARVGSVFDAQRRRRRQLTEIYQARAASYG